ncbi:MAG TPA: hypothetical protein V6C99_09390, partial [Oculatellaceae cyanobacterium]
GVLVWLMFTGLTLLAAAFVQVLHWESRFQANKALLLANLQQSARKIRQLRLRVTRISNVPGLDAPLIQLRPVLKFLLPLLLQLGRKFLILRF